MLTILQVWINIRDTNSSKRKLHFIQALKLAFKKPVCQVPEKAHLRTFIRAIKKKSSRIWHLSQIWSTMAKITSLVRKIGDAMLYLLNSLQCPLLMWLDSPSTILKQPISCKWINLVENWSKVAYKVKTIASWSAASCPQLTIVLEPTNSKVVTVLDSLRQSSPSITPSKSWTMAKQSMTTMSREWCHKHSLSTRKLLLTIKVSKLSCNPLSLQTGVVSTMIRLI